MVPFWFIGAKHIALKWKLPLKEVWPTSRHPPPLLTITPPPPTPSSFHAPPPSSPHSGCGVRDIPPTPHLTCTCTQADALMMVPEGMIAIASPIVGYTIDRYLPPSPHSTPFHPRPSHNQALSASSSQAKVRCRPSVTCCSLQPPPPPTRAHHTCHRPANGGVSARSRHRAGFGVRSFLLPLGTRLHARPPSP